MEELTENQVQQLNELISITFPNIEIINLEHSIIPGGVRAKAKFKLGDIGDDTLRIKFGLADIVDGDIKNYRTIESAHYKTGGLVPLYTRNEDDLWDTLDEYTD